MKRHLDSNSTTRKTTLLFIYLFILIVSLFVLTVKPEEEGPLMLDWFQLVNDKNVLLRFESELVIQSSNIQYEDQQARLEADIRSLLTSDGKLFPCRSLLHKII